MKISNKQEISDLMARVNESLVSYKSLEDGGQIIAGLFGVALGQAKASRISESQFRQFVQWLKNSED